MVIHIKKDNFEEEILKSKLPVMLDFSATWCGPCKMVAPAVNEMATDFKGKAKIAKLDIDESVELAQKYNVMSVPTLLYFKDGKVVDQIVGAVPKSALAERLNKIL